MLLAVVVIVVLIRGSVGEWSAWLSWALPYDDGLAIDDESFSSFPVADHRKCVVSCDGEGFW